MFSIKVVKSKIILVLISPRLSTETFKNLFFMLFTMKPSKNTPEIEEQGLEGLSQDMLLLTERLTLDQSSELNYLFPNINSSLRLLDLYFSIPRNTREKQIGSRKAFLGLLAKLSDLHPTSTETYEAAQKYFLMPEDIRMSTIGTFGDYVDFLATSKLGEDTRLSHYDQEVQERTATIPLEMLFRTSYRDTPQRSAHYDEHLASQEPNK
tara:strand:+ start:208 stop:834 length:627 start_codon:yes stop_codon:yes gene_type:complete